MHLREDTSNFDVIIIGGSYAGLSAAMALGRALRKTLVIDAGKPCNRQTPHSHNFLTQDGEPPHRIAEKAKKQVLEYDTVTFIEGEAISANKSENAFFVQLSSGKIYQAKKLILATGLIDIMPTIDGFEQCWGLSVIHCPYCHGYEVRGKKTGILASSEMAMHYAQLISNWTKDLVIFSDGPADFNQTQLDLLSQRNIVCIEKPINRINHQDGLLNEVVFHDGTIFPIEVIYSRPKFEQHSSIAKQLGSTFDEQGLIQVNMFQQTNVEGLFACGDSTTLMRSVANAVASGNMAGAAVNNQLIGDSF